MAKFHNIQAWKAADLCGTSNPKHAADNLQAGYGRLPDDQGRQQMEAFIDSL